MALTVDFLTPEKASAWDPFVESHPSGTPFHLLAWRDTIQSIFGFKPLYLCADIDNIPAGVLPLFLIQNPLSGKALISSPFAVYGGILASSPAAKEAMAQRVRSLGEELRVQYVELRNSAPEQCAGFSPVARYATFTRPVTPLTGEELVQSLPKKTRNLVRKALKNAYSSRLATDCKTFERLYSTNLRRLGTPSFPPGLFPALLRNFGPRVDVREILLDGKVVAASMNFLFKGEMHTYYAASDQNYLQYAPNMFLYYNHLLWAGRNGFHTFDFGRSKLNTGTFDFKRQWETTMRELPYEVLLVRRKELPNFSPVNPKFDLAIKVWQRLPLPLTRMIGPSLVKLFP
jgi:FemAB-related protein (PEP-CTERM system-associated)